MNENLTEQEVPSPEPVKPPIPKMSNEGLSAMQDEDAPAAPSAQAQDVPAYNPTVEKEPSKENKEATAPVAVTAVNDAPTANPNDTAPAAAQETTLPNGEKVKVTGGVHAFKDLNHQQGNEVPGYEGTCGLCSVQCVGNQFGVTNDQGKPLSEADVVNTAKDNRPPLCTTGGLPEHNGGTSQEGQQELLAKMGIPSQIKENQSMDALAKDVEAGKGVIAGVNSNELWGLNQPGGLNQFSRPDHAVTVIDTARNPQTNELMGFFINDSGNNYGNIGSGRFVSVSDMLPVWQNAGGSYVVTDKPYPSPWRSK
ncbi:MAG TPA: hypothetical protein VN376_04140 [Longilinea sp.]|nr:hypothetical protein [Longilinea sp.]